MKRRTAVLMQPGWSANILANVASRVRRQRRIRRTAWGMALLALGLGGAWKLASRDSRLEDLVAERSEKGQPVGRLVRFDDRATGRLVDGDSRADVIEKSRLRTTVVVQSGSVGFDVVHTGREFRVHAGNLEVIVVGTIFIVDRQSNGVRVSVQRGRVDVKSGGQTVAVAAGEQHWFGNAPTMAEDLPVPGNAAVAAPRRQAPVGKAKHGRWKTLAQQGDYKRAFELLKEDGEQPRDDVEELLLAADVARRSNEFEQAMPYYDRVVARYSHDPRAALAALTQGRIALHKLHHAKQAALAFAKAHALSLPAGLAEEALAGEVEAWHEAGEPARAGAAAAAYVKLYPSGAALQRVREVGGLE